jgi:UDP-N-acetylmuramoyl-L-alanyl-D-glutamate--2,6-diaminopimelate ligase
MNFLQLLDGAEVLSQTGDTPVEGLEYDSRKVKPGCVFVAMKGETTDGNRFIDRAIEQGAVAVVTDSADQRPRSQVAWAQVAHGRRALARLSANFYKHPSRRLAISGITGTNGKSTTAFLLESMLQAAGRRTLLIGTIEYHVAGRVLPAPHTTPESLELNLMFRDAVSAGATEAVMEVSSHALAQERVYGIGFDVAIFTNLTRDHLDFHGTIEEYFAAKRILFEGSGSEPPRVVILNADDEYARQLEKPSRKRGSKVVTYGLAQGDFHAENLQITSNGTRLDLAMPGENVPLWSPLIGRVNLYNILAAAAAAWSRDCSPKTIADGVAQLAHVPGRFQRVDCGQPFTVVVDYAHTDDALRNLTTLAREFVTQAGGGRVITLFGCGGDRDRTKRPMMGEAAGKGSDFVVLTSDNPRSEDSMSVINDALPGLKKTGTAFAVEADRKAAIGLAIEAARPGDIVLIAGKGHEKMQVTREGSRPFDDVEVAREFLQKAGYECAQPAER